MRLDPVYLVAPLPKPPTMPTRRAFLLAGGTLAVGATLGGACGYSIGARSSEAAGAAGEMTSSGDVELDELRRLAVKAPIEELVAQRMYFANTLVDRYREDVVLWSGIGRLSDALVSDQQFRDRRVFARFLTQLIEIGPKSATKDVIGRCDALRAIK